MLTIPDKVIATATGFDDARDAVTLLCSWYSEATGCNADALNVYECKSDRRVTPTAQIWRDVLEGILVSEAAFDTDPGAVRLGSRHIIEFSRLEANVEPEVSTTVVGMDGRVLEAAAVPVEVYKAWSASALKKVLPHLRATLRRRKYGLEACKSPVGNNKARQIHGILSAEKEKVNL